jgi:hypothetical protein
LEVQGERGLAQWARQGRRDKRRTLEFAVMLLSARPAVGLAAEFLRESVNVDLGAAGERLLLGAQNWASRRLEDDQALESCQQQAAQWLQELHNPYVRIDHRERVFAESGADRLLIAINLAIESTQLGLQGDYRRSAAREREVRHQVRQIVRLTGDFRFPPLMDRDGSMRYLPSFEWQIERLKQLFHQLLTTQDDLWPK